MAAEHPTTVILFGATGDLARRKLLPGLLRLFHVGLLPELRVVGTSLDDHDRDSFVELAHEAAKERGDQGEMRALEQRAAAQQRGPRPCARRPR